MITVTGLFPLWKIHPWYAPKHSVSVSPCQKQQLSRSRKIMTHQLTQDPVVRASGVLPVSSHRPLAVPSAVQPLPNVRPTLAQLRSPAPHHHAHRQPNARITPPGVPKGHSNLQGVDGLIPSHVLRSAYGFAIFTIAKAGFLMSVRAGTGLVVARLPDGQWSAPSAIGIGGMGFGGQVGAEVAEFVLILNSKSAVTQFMSAGSITLGGNLSVALGPIGRNAEGSGALNSKGKVAAMYSYSKTRGAFAGISVEGSAIFERQDCNVKAYDGRATATKLLSGHFDMPSWAEDLVRVLTVCAGSYTEYVDRHLPTQFPRSAIVESETYRDPSTNPFAAEKSKFTPRNKDFMEQDLFSSPAPSEPYTFGTAYASSSSDPPPKSQTKKGMFAVGFWRLNSRHNSAKTDQSTPSRQSTPAPHWMDNMRTHSPRPSQERLNLSAAINLPFQYGHSAQNSEDSNSYSKAKQGSKTDDDIASLSSIGSDDDDQGGQLQDWNHSSTHQDHEQVTGIGFELNKTDSRRNWFDSIPPTHHVISKPKTMEDEQKLKGGMIDDLISFDQIGPPSPIDCLSRSMTTNSSSMNEPDYATNDNTSRFDIFGKEELKHAKKTSLNLLPNFDRQEDKQEDKDFLVGTHMPSVVRTKTELAGYLGKVLAKFDFVGDQPGDLSFKKGDVILIVEKIDDQWWLGSIGLRRGIFPVNRVSRYTQ